MRLVAALLAVLFASPAFAQRPASPTSDDLEAAKAHYAAGSAYYEQANYADAAKEFNEAYRLSHRPDLLYNVARAHEQLGQLDDAIAALRRYLDEKPDAADRKLIESRIGNLEKRRDEKRAPPAASPPQASPQPAPASPQPATQGPPPRARFPYTVGLAIGAVGVAVLASALGTGLEAHKIHGDLEAHCPGMVCPTQGMVDDANTGKTLAVTSDALLGIGAAALAVGVVLIILESRHPPVAAARAGTTVLPTGSGLVVSF
jgi:tetratricopeptide (TPR) repeat protein